MNPRIGVIAISALTLLWACATNYAPLVTGPGASPGAKTHNAEGMTHYKMGHWDVAKGHFEAAVKAEPDRAEPHYNLGLALHRLGSHSEATAHFKKAGELAPNNPDITGSHVYRHHVRSGGHGEAHADCCGLRSGPSYGY